MMAKGLQLTTERELRSMLCCNRDLFAWTIVNMPGIHPSVMSYKLALFKEAGPVA